MDKVAEILFETSSNGVCFVSSNGRFIKVNKRLCEMLGYSEVELLKLDFQSITHHDDLASDLAQVAKVLSGEIDKYSMVKRYKHGIKNAWQWAKLFVDCDRNPDGTVKYFISQIEEISKRELTAEQWAEIQEVKQALTRNEFVLHYQPIVSMSDRSVVGYEALARWQHPQRGLLYPGDFIPALEVSHNEHLLCYYVLRLVKEAQPLVKGWLSSNLSAETLLQKDWPKASENLLRGVHVELLERSIVGSDVDQLLRQLREQGVKIAVDDYGAGYGNQALLTRQDVPLDLLKVDRSLIKELGHSDRARTVCASIVSLAKALKLETIAEGVETELQAQAVENLGFSMGQGWLFGFAVPLSGISDA